MSIDHHANPPDAPADDRDRDALHPDRAPATGSAPTRRISPVPFVVGFVVLAIVTGAACLSFLANRRGATTAVPPSARLAQRLAFHIVRDQAASAQQLAPRGADEMVAPNTDTSRCLWFKLTRAPALTGGDVVGLGESKDETGVGLINLEFSEPGAARLAEVTGKHIGEQLAIVLDGRVVGAPVIQSRITGGRAQIHRMSLQQLLQAPAPSVTPTSP